jgi:hypothetical protein
MSATIRRLVPFCALFLFSAAPIRAVILLATGDPSANTTAPTGVYADSGWQYEGQFGSFLGTVIGSNYFITAKHIGGSVGQIFVFNNIGYTTTAVFPDPSSDLQIWRVAGTFPIHAPLYSGTPGNEVNSFLSVFGRGTQRGNPVLVGSDSHLGGWLWGANDGVERWCTNIVGSIAVDAEFGQLLRVPFDNGGTSDEAHLSVGDSGGATNDYTIVFTFANNVTVQSANVSAGIMSSFSVAANIVTVNLTGIPNAQTVTVTLGQVNDGTNVSDVECAMGVLIGDTTGNGLVNSSDIAQIQSQSGQTVTIDNFREDLTANGSINSSDIALAQSQSGTALPVSGSVMASGQSALNVTPLDVQVDHAPRNPGSLRKEAC